jgi:hypothetical protein
MVHVVHASLMSQQSEEFPLTSFLVFYDSHQDDLHRLGLGQGDSNAFCLLNLGALAAISTDIRMN